LIVALFFLATFSFWLVPGILQGVSLRDLLGFSVEGKNSLLRFDRPASSLLFWGVLAIGHLVLIIAPLTAVLLTVLRKINKITLDAKMSHWLIAFGLIGSALFVIVVRHAWLAIYNLDEPTRLVTRYFIYFAVPSWLTIVALAKYLNRKDLVPLIISTIVSICLVYASYEVFFNQNWILSKRILYIDAYLPFYAQKIFFLTVIGGSVLSIFLVWKKKTQQIPIVLLLCILYINLASLPQYRNYFMDYQRGGRFLNEYIARGIIKEGMEPVEGTKFILTTAETITHTELQLTVRGLDSSDFDTTIQAKLTDYPKGTLMVLETIPGEKYLIIKSTGELDGVDKVSAFSFSGTDYELVKEN